MDAIEEVKSRLSIEDVISEYVALKRTGRNYKGLSPFTSEKTPSFIVSPEKQIWHDFSSGKGGNMFSFVMEVEGLDFKGSLELLARKAGIDLEQYRVGPKRSGPDKERLYQLLDLAAKFYQVHFSKNKAALNYVIRGRSFSKETALKWRLGYSPNNGSGLSNFAKKQGFSETELALSGLSTRTRNGNMDMFRGRIMIPLTDDQGRVIGFTARLLEDNPDAPKYINTPQTVLYDKSRHIFGLHFAKSAIRKSGYGVITEGNLDVIASHQAGVEQVVATAGTALTQGQLKSLSRFSGDIRLAFDADRAGLQATERAIPIASRAKVSLSIIEITSGKDPDDLIKQDPKLWQDTITKPVYALDWLMQRYLALLDVSSAKGKREYSDVLLPVVRGLTDEVERDHYLNAIAKVINVSVDALDQKMGRTTQPSETPRRRAVKVTPAEVDKNTLENLRTQDNFLSLMLMRPTLREFLNLIDKDMLFKDEAKDLLKFLNEHKDFDGKDSISVRNLSDYVKIESLLYEEIYHGLELNELHYEAARLQARLIEQYVKNEKNKLADQLQTADDADSRVLLEKAKHYDSLLKQVKGAI